MSEEREKVINMIKTQALKIGPQTRSAVLIEINHDGSTNQMFWHQGVGDLIYMKELVSKATRDAFDEVYKKK